MTSASHDPFGLEAAISSILEAEERDTFEDLRALLLSLRYVDTSNPDYSLHVFDFYDAQYERFRVFPPFPMHSPPELYFWEEDSMYEASHRDPTKLTKRLLAKEARAEYLFVRDEIEVVFEVDLSIANRPSIGDAVQQLVTLLEESFGPWWIEDPTTVDD